MLYFCIRNSKEWSVRLGVRTPGFHPGNRGSIPLRTTKHRLNKKHGESQVSIKEN